MIGILICKLLASKCPNPATLLNCFNEKALMFVRFNDWKKANGRWKIFPKHVFDLILVGDLATRLAHGPISITGLCLGATLPFQSHSHSSHWPTWRSSNRPTWTKIRPTNMKHVGHATSHVLHHAFYSGGSNTEHSNSESIRKPNVLKFCFRMVLFSNVRNHWSIAKWPH